MCLGRRGGRGKPPSPATWKRGGLSAYRRIHPCPCVSHPMYRYACICECPCSPVGGLPCGCSRLYLAARPRATRRHGRYCLPNGLAGGCKRERHRETSPVQLRPAWNAQDGPLVRQAVKTCHPLPSPSLNPSFSLFAACAQPSPNMSVPPAALPRAHV